jgi:thiol-disulfide isomerase/thioredoxin
LRAQAAKLDAMDARRVTAVVGLGLVGAVVVGLNATSGSGDSDQTPAAAAATDQTPTTALGTPVAEAPAAAEPAATDTPGLASRGPHPDFLQVQEWIQTDATSFADFDGKVIAVQFWTFGCGNCKATFPHMRDLYDKYGGDDFEIVGVHAPEFDFERDVEAVAAAAEDNGLTWPIAIDNEKLNFRSWQERRFWPRLFLIDRAGNVRYDHIGEGAYDEIDAAVGTLIAEGQ